MPEPGANIVTSGLGSEAMVTEGYGYTPRAGIIRPEVERFLGDTALLKIKNDVANAFTTLRVQYGEEATVEAILATLDSAVLAQPGVRDLSKFEGKNPAEIAQMAYADKGG